MLCIASKNFASEKKTFSNEMEIFHEIVRQAHNNYTHKRSVTDLFIVKEQESEKKTS
jgi:hypothetical protein